MYKLGYVDEDEGQKNSLYQFLKDDFEVVLFDITEDTNEDSLVNEIFAASLDMLVLDFRLDENGLVDFNADQLIDKIQERNLHYPLVVLTSHETDALDHLDNANLVNGKEEMLGDKIEIFKQKLNKIANSYKTELAENEAKLEVLEKKRKEQGLTPEEEDVYVDLNNYLDKTINAKGRLSRSFYSEDTNKKLDQMIAQAEEMLKKISNNS